MSYFLFGSTGFKINFQTVFKCIKPRRKRTQIKLVLCIGNRIVSPMHRITPHTRIYACSRLYVCECVCVAVCRIPFPIVISLVKCFISKESTIPVLWRHSTAVYNSADLTLSRLTFFFKCNYFKPCRSMLFQPRGVAFSLQNGNKPIRRFCRVFYSTTLLQRLTDTQGCFRMGGSCHHWRHLDDLEGFFLFTIAWKTFHRFTKQ